MRYFEITPVQTLGLPFPPPPPIPLSLSVCLLSVCLSVSVPVLSVCLSPPPPPPHLSLSLSPQMTSQLSLSFLRCIWQVQVWEEIRAGVGSRVLGPAAFCGARCMLLLGLSAMSTSPVRYTSVSVLHCQWRWGRVSLPYCLGWLRIACVGFG